MTIRGSQNRIEANLIGVTETTAPGNAGHGIEIDGTTTAASQNQVLNNTIGGSGHAGVKVHGALATNNKLEANRIGLNHAASAARPNATGIWITEASDTHLLSNVISGNTGAGVLITAPAPRTLLESNLIGITPANQSLGNGQEGVRIVAPSGTHDITLRTNTISANAGDGFYIQAAGVKLFGNRIGSDLSGQAARGNGGDGIEVNGVAGVVIGQTGQGNLIIANAGRGIAALGANQTQIVSNLIGLGGTGVALGNQQGGVYVAASSSVMIGGPTVNDRNLISANKLFGIALVNAHNNKVQTNYIGPGLNGASQPGGPAQPIGLLIDSSSENIIGSDGANGGFGNLISGHSGPGVLIRGESAQQNRLSSNVIGLRADLGGPLANGGSGIQLSDGASENFIGGTTPQAANFIAGNAGHGIALDTGATLNEVKFNFIGVNPSQQVIGNGGSGVLLDHANNNLIGDPTATSGNNIRGNAQHGVHVVESTGNRILGNSIYLNNAGGITHTGPLASLPRQIVIRDIERTGNSVTAKFEFLATPGTTVRIELFASRQAPSGKGQGELPVAAGTVVVPASGLAQVQQTFTVPDGTYIYTTATLTDANNTTFGFSRAAAANDQPTAITSLVTSGPTNDILPITFTATLLTISGTPTGVVEFYDGQTLLGQANVNASKQATLSVRVPQQGTHQIYAIYKGSTTYAGSVSAPLVLNVTAGPRPTANTDIVNVIEDGSVQILVLANDVAPSGATLDPASIVITQPPAHGTVMINPTTGVITYKPDENYDGTDLFRYTVTDSRGATSAPGMVTITVTDIPEPYHNKTLPFDVSGDGDITSYDVAVAINYLNAVGTHTLSAPTSPVTLFFDTDGNNVFAPIDVLHIIIYLNANGPLIIAGEAEPVAEPPLAESFSAEPSVAETPALAESEPLYSDLAATSPAAVVDQALQEWLAFEGLEADARKRTR